MEGHSKSHFKSHFLWNKHDIFRASKKLSKQQPEEEDSSRTPRIREVSESKSQRHRRRRRSSSDDQEVEVLSARLETKPSIGVQTKPETPRQSKEMVDEAVGTPRSGSQFLLSMADYLRRSKWYGLLVRDN